MSAFTTRIVLSAPLLSVMITVGLAGCANMASPRGLPAGSMNSPDETGLHGVTANSGGDTRGTVLYQPAPQGNPRNPYAPVSDKFVVGQRQTLAWELAEMDRHAHQQAAQAYPVPTPTQLGYSKKNASAQAERQAEFNTYLLEKYHAHFCNQFHVSYHQIILLIQESREKNWPMPPASDG